LIEIVEVMRKSLWEALPIEIVDSESQLRFLSIGGWEQGSARDWAQGVPFPIPDQRPQLNSETGQFLLPGRSLPRGRRVTKLEREEGDCQTIL
jgi:hypothetical protein